MAVKNKKRATMNISWEVKGFLDSVKRPGQSYDGVIRELYMHWKSKQETESKK